MTTPGPLSTMTIPILAPFLTVAVLVALIIFRRSRNYLGYVPGPQSPSWLYGNTLELLLGSPYGKYEFEWQRQFGPVYRFKGCFGEDRLMISDPATVKHMLADPQSYVKSRQHQFINATGFGEHSLLYVHGETHRRVRAVMNPAFSASSVRSLIPCLKKVALELSERWQIHCNSEPSEQVLNVYPSLHETTLQAVGEGVMGYDFNADKEFAKSYHDLVIAASSRSEHSILADSILPFVPEAILNMILRYPPPTVKKLLDHKAATNSLASQLIKNKIEALELGIEPDKDLFSVLVGQNAGTGKLSNKMSFEEIRDQFGTVTVAGEDTTANTIAWALYALANNPSWQEILRSEFSEVFVDENFMDYDRLPFLNAFIKEVMRVYSAVPQTERVVARDNVLPLSEPIRSVSGELISEIPVKKGQYLIIAISSYNRLPSVWGPDADEFKPSRWLKDEQAANGSSLGPYSNLLTFFGGGRTCIGWRFALLEIQVVITELIRKFSFSLPAGVIIRPNYAITLVPMTGDGKTDLPLCVTCLQ